MRPAQPATGQAASYDLITLLQLGRRAREADRLESLGFTMMNETLQLVQYRQAALWLGQNGIGKICTLSGVPQIEGQSPYVQWLTKLGQYCQKQFQLNVQQKNIQSQSSDISSQEQQYVLKAANLPEGLAQEWENWFPEYGLWLPLIAHQKEEGGIILTKDTPWQPHECVLLSELIPIYAHALSVFASQQRWHIQLKNWIKPNQHGWKLLLVLAGMAAMPVHLSVVAPAEVLAKDPFVVKAPLEGIIDRFQVQPNQRVKAGTVLFNLEPATIQSRYDLAQKAYDTAEEEYRQTAQLAVTDDKGRLEMIASKGHLNEKAVELSYSAEQLGRLQVKAARDGVAVFNDPNQWQGKAVTVGERILQLADPHQVELEVRLPVADTIDLEPGSTITLYPNANPTASYQATLERMAYRAEVMPEGVLAYRIKARFLPDQSLLRIGQMGTATLRGERVPLIYYVLRRPLTAARQWLGW